MRNHFIISYAGNKRTEVEEIYKHLKLDDKKIIVEPFAGSSAISYYISTLNKNKFKYIINDINKDLINLYNLIKDDIKLNFFNCHLEIIYNKIKSFKNINDRKLYYLNLPNGTLKYYIHNKLYKMRPGLYPNKEDEKRMKYILKCPIFDFIKNEDIIFYNKCALEIINEYKTNKDAIIILDPPYLMVRNDFYEGYNINIYEFLLDNPDITNYYLILEYTWLIKYLFKHKKFILYDKQYTGHKKKTVMHSIIY